MNRVSKKSKWAGYSIAVISTIALFTLLTNVMGQAIEEAEASYISRNENKSVMIEGSENQHEEKSKPKIDRVSLTGTYSGHIEWSNEYGKEGVISFGFDYSSVEGLGRLHLHTQMGEEAVLEQFTEIFEEAAREKVEK